MSEMLREVDGNETAEVETAAAIDPQVTETPETVTREEVRQEIVRQRSEIYFQQINDFITQHNRYFRPGVPFKYGYEILERKRANVEG